MKKRPLSIVIIAVIYFFEPAGNLIQAAYVNGLPLFGNNSIISHLIWSDWIILSVFPVVAVGVYRVRKWGWYLFLGFSVVLISYNLYVYLYINPNYKLQTVILFILIVTGISAVFFRKHVYAPYFNPRLRWWEVASRYRVKLPTTIVNDAGSMDCQLLDISSTGCFIEFDGNLNLGDDVWLLIDFVNNEINCLGKVIRKSREPSAPGYGIYFHAMSQETRRKLKYLVRTLKNLGCKDRQGSIPVSEIQKTLFKKNIPCFVN
jgi:hypothetical protein